MSQVTSERCEISQRANGYRKLIAWKKADELAYEVYLVSKKFPKNEVCGITSQLRRAALSVPTNLVEGCGRQGKGELKHFVNIALGSLSETEYLLEFSHRLGYMLESELGKLQILRQEVGALLWGFYKSI